MTNKSEIIQSLKAEMYKSRVFSQKCSLVTLALSDFFFSFINCMFKTDWRHSILQNIILLLDNIAYTLVVLIDVPIQIHIHKT